MVKEGPGTPEIIPAPEKGAVTEALSLCDGWGKGPKMETFERILAEVSSGKTLRATARELGLDESTIRYHIAKHKALATRYHLARMAQAEAWADEMVEIADDGTNDWMTVTRRDGTEIEVENREVVNRSRLRFDARRWLMAKQHPAKYGEKLELGGGLENTNKSLSVVVQVFETSPSTVRALKQATDAAALTAGLGERPRLTEEVAGE